MKPRHSVLVAYCAAVVGLLALAGCGGGGGGAVSGPVTGTGTGAPASVQVSWTGNRETTVNSPGGGYRVYYSSTPGFNIASANVIDVPFSGGAVPTSTTLTLTPGTHYVKVTAYSALNPGGSAPSAEIAVAVP